MNRNGILASMCFPTFTGFSARHLDRSDRHYTNQKWLRRDFGDKLPSDAFREHSLACYVTDKTSLRLRHESGSTSSRGSATTRIRTVSGPMRPSRYLPN